MYNYRRCVLSLFYILRRYEDGGPVWYECRCICMAAITCMGSPASSLLSAVFGDKLEPIHQFRDVRIAWYGVACIYWWMVHERIAINTEPNRNEHRSNEVYCENCGFYFVTHKLHVPGSHQFVIFTTWLIMVCRFLGQIANIQKQQRRSALMQSFWLNLASGSISDSVWCS